MKTEEISNRREHLADWVAGGSSEAAKDNLQEEIYDPKFPPGNGSRRLLKAAPTPSKIKWDLRPLGEVGNLAGAGAREKARAEYMQEQGDLLISETLFEAGGTQVLIGSKGEEYERDFIFCEPIPMNEMTPHDPDAQGYAIPIWPIGKSLWLHGVEADIEK